MRRSAGRARSRHRRRCRLPRTLRTSCRCAQRGSSHTTSSARNTIGRRGQAEAERHQLREAADAGREATSALDRLDDELGSASGWSTYDTFFGGGTIPSSIKHDHMDRAADISRSADAVIAVFVRELGDVGVAAVAETLEMSEGTRFMDVWFDNIFTDLSVRERLSQARQTVSRVRRKVADKLDLCSERLEAATARMSELEDERLALLRV